MWQPMIGTAICSRSRRDKEVLSGIRRVVLERLLLSLIVETESLTLESSDLTQ